MKVLVITGDKSFGPGNARYDLQRSAVDELAVVYWGRGALWPKIPPGHFDVVTAQDPFWRGHLAWHIARLIGAKLNIQVHTNLDAQPWWRRVLAQIQLRHADSVRVVSEKIKQQVGQMGVRVPIYVLPIFVDISAFSGLGHAAHPRFAKTILWMGRFETEKNPLEAIRILRTVRETGIDAGLVMLGKGSLESALRAAAQAYATHIEFVGWQHPAEYLKMADVAVCTSKHESYGASIIEALAARVPVVAPDVGVAHEAGAIIAPRAQLAQKTAEVLRAGVRGELKLELPTAGRWAESWKKTL